MGQTYSSGCGGPSYAWEDDGHISIGGQTPSQPLPPGVAQWRDLIYAASEKHGIPAHYIAGIMALESGGKADAGSPAGAMGLMQLLHSTANTQAGRKLSADEVYDPATNIDLGTKLLRVLWDKYSGDPIKMAFAYNAGSARCGTGCVRDYADKAGGMPCIQTCSGNQFGLKADCYASTGTTVDYGGRVAKYANSALDSGEFPLQNPNAGGTPESGSSSGGSSSKGGLLFLGLAGLAAAAAAVHVARKRKPKR
jgi:hypothetical protein